jgi:hypothetical protein
MANAHLGMGLCPSAKMKAAQRKSHDEEILHPSLPDFLMFV